MSPGDMGFAVGQALVNHGLRVIAALGERCVRTHALADEAGITAVFAESLVSAQRPGVFDVLMNELAAT
jgi:hypothetical protein